jgi:hypothetical protein
VQNLPEPVRDLLAAILEAIDLPHPATVGDTEAHDRLLNTRIALRSLLDDGPVLGLAWSAAYLREQLAKHPVTGYVTVDQAHERLDAGMSWTDAVNLPADDEDGMCPACDTTPIERCVACGLCRCDRHDTCARPDPRTEPSQLSRDENRCGRCRWTFDPHDKKSDGHARHGETPYCRRCYGAVQ